MAQNTPLPQINGPIIPVWGARDLAGYPGEIYANVLKDRDTNKMPNVAHWNPTEPGSDTRLNPGDARQSEYSFVAPSNGTIVITARLIYRNIFYDIATQKKITPTDIIAAAMECNNLPTQPEMFECR
jgi:hypothetical protein